MMVDRITSCNILAKIIPRFGIRIISCQLAAVFAMQWGTVDNFVERETCTQEEGG